MAAFTGTSLFTSRWPKQGCDLTGKRIHAVKRSFATACRRAGITDFHIHDLRHTCAARLVQAGVSIREVAELLRHSDIRVTMRYAHLAPESVRSAVARLEISASRSSHEGESGEQSDTG